MEVISIFKKNIYIYQITNLKCLNTNFVSLGCGKCFQLICFLSVLRITTQNGVFYNGMESLHVKTTLQTFEMSIYVSVLQYTFGVKLKHLLHMSTTKKVRGIPGHTVTSNVKSSSYNKLQVQIKILLFHLLFLCLKVWLET